jgi:hypothetical protein
MTLVSALIGRRLDSLHQLDRPGDYCRRGAIVWGIDPTGESVRLDERWPLVEEDDGTLTVSGSIWVDKPNGWHGHLERGVWTKA